MSISRGRAKSKTWNIQHFSACQLITIGTTASTEQQHNDLLFFTAGNQQLSEDCLYSESTKDVIAKPDDRVVRAYYSSCTLHYGLRVEYSNTAKHIFSFDCIAFVL